MASMTRMEKHRKAFGGKEKPIIGCLHLRPLPGTPMWDRDMSIEEHIDLLLADAKVLSEAGFDAFVFANEGDYPYLTAVGPEIVATYTRIVTSVMREYKGIPFGVGIMLDSFASIAVAKATGASFSRGMFHGTMATDFGFVDKPIGEIFRFAKRIGAEDLNIYSAVQGHFGEFMEGRTPVQRAMDSKLVIPFTGFLMGSPAPGTDPKESTMAKLKELDPTAPLILNNGAKKETIKDLLPYCDGVLVGTSIKKDGYLYNPVDRDRAMAFMDAVRKA